MERYRETTAYGKEQIFWMILAVLALALWLGYEVFTYQPGKSITIFIYIICLGGLMVWRYAVSYTYILTDRQLIVISHLLGVSRQIVIDLNKTESYSNRYVKSFFKKTKISSYAYRYSSIDKNSTRIFVYNRDGKMQALLMKVSDRFIDELKSLLPNNFLDLMGQKK